MTGTVDSDGSSVRLMLGSLCRARFSTFMVRVDQPRPVETMSGAEVLFAFNGPTHLAQWREFQRIVLDHHGVVVVDSHMPKRLSKELHA